MEKNRDARFPDVNSFVKAVTSRSLATAPGTEQVPARPVTVAATERISREPSRTPVYITFAIGVVVALAFTIWKVMPREPEEAPLPQQPPSTSTTSPRRSPLPRTPPAAEGGHAHTARRTRSRSRAAGGEADRAEAGAGAEG